MKDGNPDLDTPLIVFSQDTHMSPRAEDFAPYCPKQHRKDLDRAIEREAAKIAAIMLQMSSEGLMGAGAFSAREALNQRSGGSFDMHARIRDMDRSGVVAENILHGGNFSLFPFGPTDYIFGSFLSEIPPEPETLRLLPVGIRMYNRWLADVVTVERKRHVATAHMPYWDPKACLEEVRWAKSAGMDSMLLPPPRLGFIEYDRPEWEPVWAACEDLELPLQTHTGAIVPGQFTTYIQEPAPAHWNALVMLEGGTWQSRRGLYRLIFGGVFQRHPKLKIVLTELEDFWNQAVAEMDIAYRGCYDSLRSVLPKPPSEYFRRNVFCGASFMSRYEAQSASRGGWSGNFMWGTDYPHPEGCWKYPESDDEPSTVRLHLRDTFSGVPPEEARAMIGENAVRVYGLDRAALLAVAKRIGAPTLREIGQPVSLDEIPDLGGFKNSMIWGAFHKIDQQAIIDQVTGASRERRGGLGARWSTYSI